MKINKFTIIFASVILSLSFFFLFKDQIVLGTENKVYKVKAIDVGGMSVDDIYSSVNDWILSKDKITIDSISYDTIGNSSFLIKYYSDPLKDGPDNVRVQFFTEKQPKDMESALNSFLASLDVSYTIKSVDFGPASSVFVVYSSKGMQTVPTSSVEEKVSTEVTTDIDVEKSSDNLEVKQDEIKSDEVPTTPNDIVVDIIEVGDGKDISDKLTKEELEIFSQDN